MCTKSRVGFQSNKWESSLVRPLQLFKIPSYTPSLWSICVFHRKANGLLLLHFKNTQKRRTKARRPPHNNPFLNWNIFSKASWEVPTPTPSPNGVSDAAMSRNRCRHHQSLTFNVFNLSWTLCIQCWEGHRLYFWSFLSNWESLPPMITFQRYWYRQPTKHMVGQIISLSFLTYCSPGSSAWGAYKSKAVTSSHKPGQ